jgi:hypothetical protein
MTRSPARRPLRSLLIAALAAAILIPATAAAPEPAVAIETGTTGRVIDGNGDGIVTRMHLFPVDELHAPVATLFSAADGTFEIPDVDAGSYRLRAESQDLQGPAPVWLGDTRDPQLADAFVIDGAPQDLGDIVYDAYPVTPPVADLRVITGYSDGTDAPSSAELYRVGETVPRAAVQHLAADHKRFFNVPTGLWDVRAIPHPLSGDLPSWFVANSPDSSVDRPSTPQVTMGGSFRTVTIYTQADPYLGLFPGGTVTTEDGEPIAGALVTLHHEGGSGYPRYTDASGAFTFSDQMPDGDYRIEVSHPGFIGEWWEDAPDEASSSAVRVEDGRTAAAIDVRLAGTSVLQGVVTGPSNEPLDDAPVHLLSAPELNAANIVATARTDEHGVYRFTGVPAGTYYLFFRAPSGTGLLSEWWNDTRVAAEAEAIQITGVSAELSFDARLADDSDREEQDGVCPDPFGNVIPCPDPGCEEGDEVCPAEPECTEGDTGCPAEPECDEHDSRCPGGAHDCPSAGEQRSGHCPGTGTVPGSGSGSGSGSGTGGAPGLARTGGAPEGALLASAALLAAGLVCAAVSLRRRAGAAERA